MGDDVYRDLLKDYINRTGKSRQVPYAETAFGSMEALFREQAARTEALEQRVANLEKFNERRGES